MKPVDPSYADQRVRSVQALYRRALSAWASDLLSLRRDGLSLTCWVETRRDPELDGDRRVA